MNKYYKWSFQELVQHRTYKLRGALNRRDDEYLKERQAKLNRVIPNSLLAQARITFLKGEI